MTEELRFKGTLRLRPQGSNTPFTIKLLENHSPIEFHRGKFVFTKVLQHIGDEKIIEIIIKEVEK